MLKGLDSFLAWLSWTAAGLLVVMLIIGPKVVAHDKSPYTAPVAGGGGRVNGKAIFTANCGSCHTLQVAGTNGHVGPDLDGTPLSATDIAKLVKNGPGGVMPAFAGKLSDAEIAAVAAFVAKQH